MTTTHDTAATTDIAALQRLPEDDPSPSVLDPTCATTGVTAAVAPASDEPGTRSDTHREPEADAQT